MVQNYRKSGAHSSQKPFPAASDPVTSEVIGDPYNFRAAEGNDETRLNQVYGNFYGKKKPDPGDRPEGLVVSAGGIRLIP